MSYRLYGGLRYVGPTGLIEQPGSSWSVSAFDLDVFNVTLAGPNPDLANYIKTLQKHSVLVPGGIWKTFAEGSTPPKLFLKSWHPTWGRAFSSVAMEFVGEADSRGRQPLYTADTREQSVTLHEVKTGTQTTINYKAQTMTVRYFALSMPQGQFVANTLLKSNESFLILSRTGNATGSIVRNQHGLKNSPDYFATETVSGNLHVAQTGPYFECTETNEGRFIDTAFDQPILRGGIGFLNPATIKTISP